MIKLNLQLFGGRGADSVYGGAVDYDYKGVEVHYYDNKVTERMKNLKNERL